MSRPHYHIGAAVIENTAGEILLAKRPEHLDQGGLWEFPGGKVEPGESLREGLARELREELGIGIEQAHPLIRIPWDYPQHSVLLDVWRVTAFSGEPHGAEGQPLRWVGAENLPEYAFPPANRAIVSAARLPHRYHITPDPGGPAEWSAFLQQLDKTLERGARLLQLRAKKLDTGQYRELAQEVVRRCHHHGAQCLLNSDAALVVELGADGVHLDSGRLQKAVQRPLEEPLWVAASCHNEAQLRQAMAIGASFALMSPVKATASHPGVEGIGWVQFAQMAELAAIPLYGLGGMEPGDERDAWQHGGQGIAAIRALWG